MTPSHSSVLDAKEQDQFVLEESRLLEQNLFCPVIHKTQTITSSDSQQQFQPLLP